MVAKNKRVSRGADMHHRMSLSPKWITLLFAIASEIHSFKGAQEEEQLTASVKNFLVTFPKFSDSNAMVENLVHFIF